MSYYDWQPTTSALLYEQRMAFALTRPSSFALITGVADNYGARPKPRVYDSRERAARDARRARL